MRFVRSRSVAVCALFLILYSDLYAAALPTLAIPPMAGSTNQKATEAVAQALQKSQRVIVVEKEAVSRYLNMQKKNTPDRKPNPEATKALQKGQEAYRKLKLKQ